LRIYEPYNVTWPVVLDIEEAASVTARTTNLTKEQRTDFAIAFCETIKEAGYTPMLYCNIRWFIQELDLARLTEYDKWLAQYFNRPFFPYELQMWQYTSSGRVDGIIGNVDLNLSFVDYSNPDRDESEE
jgi:lysozyme